MGHPTHYFLVLGVPHPIKQGGSSVSVKYNRTFDPETLRGLGFDLNRDVHDVLAGDGSLSIKRLTRSLRLQIDACGELGATVRIECNHEVRPADAAFVVYILITTIRQVAIIGQGPCWYFEGLVDGPFLAEDSPTVRCIVDKDEMGALQFITDLPIGYNRLPGT